jgi:hypothetical protein
VADRVIGDERLAASAPLQLVLLAGTNPLIVRGIDGKQHPHVPSGVGPQHHQIAILSGLGVDLRPVTELIAAVRIEPHAHGGIRGDLACGRGRDRGAHRRQQQQW